MPWKVEISFMDDCGRFYDRKSVEVALTPGEAIDLAIKVWNKSYGGITVSSVKASMVHSSTKCKPDCEVCS